MGANKKHEATYGGRFTPTTDGIRDIWVDRKLYHLPKSTGIALVPTVQAEFDRWLEQVRAEAKREALEEAAENLQNHPRLRKTQFAWALYPEHMADKEKTFNECADILRNRAEQIRGIQ
ncbi:hypothetical protein [Glutamicibacter sp. NPDC087344]|uniref:hypothetical protein n=1 Tax=Glutamicibacter sp. NPDC087344 TaxID=3363994 RepID=UPI00380F8D92